MTRIAFIGGKGGVGKTTSSMLTACSLAARHGKGSVALLDLDPQESAYAWWVHACNRGPELPFRVIPADGPSTLAEPEGARWLIADCPPGRPQMHGAVIEWADFVVLPTKPGELDRAAILPIIQRLNTLQKPFGVLVTQAKRNTLEVKGIAASIAAAGANPFMTMIPHSVRVSRLAMGLPSARDIDNSMYGQFVVELEDAVHRVKANAKAHSPYTA